MSDNLAEIKKYTEDLLESLGFKAEIFAVMRSDSIIVNIQSENSGLLIGSRGENINALQHILRILIEKNLDCTKRVILDVNNYKEKQLEELEKSVQKIAHRVRETKKTYEFYPMSAYKRRVIHLVTRNIADIRSESCGEGSSRRVIIRYMGSH